MDYRALYNPWAELWLGLGWGCSVLSVSLSHLTYYCEAQSINITGLRLTQINIMSVRLTPLPTCKAHSVRLHKSA